ncbi:MAG: bifunctional 5,10-methylenetetrahydrofolate dehydrogenase/5,10-methenyltetrahydrofolate cyclohydrolase [Planctomycetota bacterium]|jgi:methylenetetrahydrofolate dehydrogenase (NADP+)/methenyltetrahydrofolate cyclohydrolase|nr:bifunctional 5,10-methylenetetrahydrofolate dehydrogenase/5,10-methenyltetrahydrofolate cyclohydrolase [Planctomycetota bacterium]
MAAIIIESGKATKKILAETAEGVQILEKAGRRAVLAAVQANRDPGSDWYARAQAKHARENGIEHRLIRLDPGIGGPELANGVRAVSANPEVSGVIVLTPFPAGADRLAIAEAILPDKDAEGAHPLNLGRLMAAPGPFPVPCTAKAAMALITLALGNLSGRHAVVIGRSATVGKPLAMLLLAENATVTIAHTRSDLRAVMRKADIVVAAAGAAGARWRVYEAAWRRWRENGGERPAIPDLGPLIRADMVRRGATVVDVGDNQVPAGFDKDGAPLPDSGGNPDMRYAGDVDFARVAEIASCITPPRGSVGPLTNAFLLLNTVRSALAQYGLAPAGSMA